MKKYYLAFVIPLLINILFGETITVSGKVVDKKNNPIPGVNIYSGTAGVVSQADGSYSINVNETSIVTFSHIGFNDVSVLANTIVSIIKMNSTMIDGKKIIVKAELGTQNLFNVPSSITILNNRELEFKNDNHFQNLIDLIPNLNYAGGTSRPRYFQIRGIGERSQYVGEGAPNFSVGFMVDGIDFSGIGMTGMLFDMQQIEVFKGPQSSIYGPNAIAGLINITSAQPTPYIAGKSMISIGSDNQKLAGFAVGGPLSSKLLFRFAFQKHSQNGFRENVFKNLTNTNKRNEMYTRIKLNWAITPIVNLHFVSFNSNLNNGYDVWSVDNNKDYITYSDEQGMDSQKSYSNSFKINCKDIIGANAFYQYTNSTNKMEHSYDGDWANNNYWLEFPYNFNPDSTYWEYSFFDKTIRNRGKETHEIRISSDKTRSSSWLVGYHSSRTKELDDATGWLFGGDATSLSTNFNIINTAIYAQSLFRISNNLNMILNIRNEDNYTTYLGEGLNWDWDVYDYVVIPQVSEEIQHSFSGGKLAMVYTLNNSMNVFTSISKGYKAGGINQNPNLSKSSRFFNPEFNTNVEAGIKFISDKIVANFNLFSMNRNDQQVQISSQQEEGNPNSFNFYTSNATTGTNKGIEFDSKVKLINGIILRSSCGLLKTHVDAYEFWTNDTTITILGNRDQAMAPLYNFSLGVTYSHSSGLYADVEFTGKDGYYFSDSHNQKSDAYQLLNLTTGYFKDSWSLSIWGKNILDARYATRGFYFGNEPIWNEELHDHEYPDKLYVSYGDPLNYGVSLKYHF